MDKDNKDLLDAIKKSIANMSLEDDYCLNINIDTIKNNNKTIIKRKETKQNGR